MSRPWSICGLVAAVWVGAFLGACNKEPAAPTASPRPPGPPTAPSTPRAPVTAVPPATAPSIERSTSVRPTTQPATAPATIPPTPATAPQAQQPQDGKVANFAGLNAPKPVTWQWNPPSNKMILAEYVVPGRDGADQARIAVIPAGGTLEANIERWKGQFRNPDGSPVEPRSVTNLEADGMPVTIVEFAGEYRGMSGFFTPDQLFLTAIVEAPSGQVFIRFVGPTATVETNREEFMEMVRGLQITEAQK